MKKTFILSLLALICIAAQAQKPKNIKVRANGHPFMIATPKSSTDEKTGLKIIDLSSTENNSWHENIDIIDNMPVVEDMESIFKDMKSIYQNGKAEGVSLMSWRLTDEGKNTVLHCYFMMNSDVVTNIWLGGVESTILDKETGIIYQAKKTVPERCYNKVFGVKGKEGTVLDMQIVFPLIPENAKDLAIYGVPNWAMRGMDVQQSALTYDGCHTPAYDSIPNIHLANMVKDSVNFNRNVHESWAVYNDVHTIKPVKEKTMALWRTPDATYLAIATEQNWLREYYGYGGKTMLLDNQGHQYKCKGVMGFPNDKLFWIEGYPGDYFAIVLVFEPLPLYVDTFTYIEPEGEPFEMMFANWDGEVITNLEVSQLRKNQKLFDYHPRVVVK